METAANPKPEAAFRNYAEPARDSVREFYRQSHARQTYAFVLAKKAEFLRFNRREIACWDALDDLNALVDDSDPDTAQQQVDHLLQTAEAMRAEYRASTGIYAAECGLSRANVMGPR